MIVYNAHLCRPDYTDCLTYNFTSRGRLEFPENKYYDQFGLSDYECYYSDYIDNIYHDNITWVVPLIGLSEDENYGEITLLHDFDNFLDSGEAYEASATDNSIKLLLGAAVFSYEEFPGFIPTNAEEHTDTLNRYDEVIDYVDDNIFNEWCRIEERVCREFSYIRVSEDELDLFTKVAETLIYCKGSTLSSAYFNNLVLTFPTLIKQFTLLDELAPFITKEHYDQVHQKYSDIIEEHLNVNN